MSPERPSVLLVDDDARLLALLAVILQQEGFEVATTSSATGASELLRSIRFDAVVTDVVFDGRPEGAHVLASALELQPTAVVVLMTGYPLIEGAVAAIRQGARDYLQKPVDPLLLSAWLHRALNERQIAEPTLQFGDLAEILTAMVANTIERVDPYTAGHGARTRKYCRYLGRSLGLEPPRLERLELAAIAHDYGKIYLDDLSFLTKAGPLTEAEYAAVQTHPLLGARKLGHHEYLREVCRYVVEHHERWNGSGYPRALAGEQISLPGRILCVVEVFDSLATRRAYKESWDLARCRQFFAQQAGQAFDPEVTAAFLALLDEHGHEWAREPQRARAEAAAGR